MPRIGDLLRHSIDWVDARREWITPPLLPILCGLAGALLGVWSIVCGSVFDGREHTGLLSTAALGLALTTLVAAPFGGALGLALSPLALLFCRREEVVPAVIWTAAWCVPVIAVLAAAGNVELGHLALITCGLFLVLVARRCGRHRWLWILCVLSAGLLPSAARLVAHHSLPEDVPSLIQAMDTPDQRLEQLALRRLVEIGEEGLIQALSAPRTRTRHRAAQTLRSFPSDRVRAALQRARRDPCPSVAGTAEASLRSMR